MDRRTFIAASALTAAGGLVLGPRAAVGGTPASDFKGYLSVDPDLFRGINRVADPANLSMLEKKHAPVIVAPKTVRPDEPFQVEVTVGEVVHPMSTGHYIHYVALLAGNEPAGRVELSPTLSVPKATFNLQLDKPVTLVVREYCNLHGLWESRMDLALA